MQSHQNTIDVESLLRVARAAARKAAKIISGAMDSDRVVTKNFPGDLVTHLDVSAEKAIRDVLARARPDDLIVGEELDDSGLAGTGIRWSIDPIDGTSNRVKGSPLYAVSIAAKDLAQGRWLVGVVHAPDLGREYYASRGCGSWLSRAGAPPTRLRGPAAGSGSRLLGTGFSYDPAMRVEQLSALAERMSSFDDLRSIGSAALGLCAVADGSFDAFVETDLYEFDWAAGALIAEEAGVSVARPDTQRGAIFAGAIDDPTRHA